MKKLLFIPALSLSLFAAECPNLSLISTNSEISKHIKNELSNSFPSIYKIYHDIIIGYNHLDDDSMFLKYVKKDTLEQLASTQIWGSLIALDALNIENKDVIYKSVVNNIDNKNPNWCYLSSYKILMNEIGSIESEDEVIF